MKASKHALLESKLAQIVQLYNEQFKGLKTAVNSLKSKKK